jgi:hypothetical protein
MSVILILLVSGPATAFDVRLSILNGDDFNQGEIISIKGEIAIDANERVDLSSIELVINTSDKCEFNYNNGNFITGNSNLCKGITLNVNKSNSLDYGYGYGYGYGYFDGNFTYDISIDTSFFEPDEYSIKLIAKVGSTTKISDSEAFNVTVPASFIGDSEENATSIIITNDWKVSLVDDGVNEIIIPNGTVITSTDSNLTINMSKFSSDLSVVTNLNSVQGSLQFGIPEQSLTFNPAITIKIFVGTNLNGNTLNVFRSTNSNGPWGDPLTTCTVSAGLCTFTTTQASYFAATIPQQTTTTGGTVRRPDEETLNIVYMHESVDLTPYIYDSVPRVVVETPTEPTPGINGVVDVVGQDTTPQITPSPLTGHVIDQLGDGSLVVLIVLLSGLLLGGLYLLIKKKI